MTQFFTYRGLSLARAPLPVRLLLTAFLVLGTLGLAVGIVNYQVRTGLSAAGSAAWYRQGIASPSDAEGPPPASDPGRSGKTPLELLDATHPHLFNQALLFFLLGHVVALCAVPVSVKTSLYGAGFVAVLVDNASPWLIRYGGPGWAWLQLGGHVLLATAFLGMVLLPLREMWLGRRGSGMA